MSRLRASRLRRAQRALADAEHWHEEWAYHPGIRPSEREDSEERIERLRRKIARLSAVPAQTAKDTE